MDTRSNRIQNSFLRTEDQRNNKKKKSALSVICFELYTIQHTTKELEKTALLMSPVITYFVEGDVI